MMAANLPSATLLLTAWAAGGLLSLAGGLTYAELGGMFPKSGGVYVYLREAFGPLAAFLYGWAAFLVFWSGGIAAVAVGFAEYMRYFTPSLPSPLLAVAAITILGGINYVGVRTGNATNLVLTTAKVSGLAAL